MISMVRQFVFSSVRSLPFFSYHNVPTFTSHIHTHPPRFPNLTERCTRVSRSSFQMQTQKRDHDLLQKEKLRWGVYNPDPGDPDYKEWEKEVVEGIEIVLANNRKLLEENAQKLKSDTKIPS